ncbi:MAG: FHA domain-containing serine/threonine-protein kinase, partial [Planctomycetota bacterium]
RPTADRKTAAEPSNARGFFKTLARSDLLPREQVEELTWQYAEGSSRNAAEELIRQGSLTRYQADRLRAGRYRGFFLDRYRLLAVLGAGGMGTVYVARDEGDGPTGGQKVALKVLAEGLRDDAGMIARLRYEGVAAGRVDHPNVVRSLRFCKADNGPGDRLLVMEFVEAVSAEELLIRGGAVKSTAACDIARQAALGLAACHEANLIHRDVKPANLLVAADGTVKVADFGLALLTDQAAVEFSLQMIFGHDCLGSADYMAPEQSRDSVKIDVRADLYSLGCTLYSLLTARVPFPAKTGRDVLKAHRRAPVPDVRLKAPEVPAEVAALVARLMAKDPDDRPASAAEAAALLEPFAKRKPVTFDFESILHSRAKAAAKKAECRKKDAARTADRGQSPAPAVPTEAERETTTTADLDTARPGSERRTDSSSILSAAALSRGRSAADYASEILGSGIAGSQVRESLTHLSHVGRRFPSAADSAFDSSVVEDWPAGEPAPPTPAEKPSAPLSPPTRLVRAGLAGWFAPQIPVRGARLSVGGAATADVKAPGEGIAQRHCQLTWNGRGWSVADLGGGTAVNGVDLLGDARGELGHGDRLRLGRTEFVLKLGTVRKPLGPWIAAAIGGLAVLGGALAYFLS